MAPAVSGGVASSAKPGDAKTAVQPAPSVTRTKVRYTPPLTSGDARGLRAAVVASARLDEVIKWGHLVYLSNGPVLLIRAEEQRVLLGFWRGQRLREIEGRLKPGGKYEMATLELRQGEEIDAEVVRRLVEAAVQLNETLGDPTDI